MTEVAEDSLDGMPVTLARIVGVPTEEICDERRARAVSVGEVSGTADSRRLSGGGW